MPNFLIIGAAKSGTTALYSYLKQHPEVYMSPVKEPRFFAFEGEELAFNGPKGHGTRFNEETITDISLYQSLFEGVKNEKAIGEASPAYLSSAVKAAERIYHYLPKVKLIAILRQPAERAYSAFLHTTKSGRETNLNFESVLQLEEKRSQENWGAIWQHKHLGFYYNQLLPYYQTFPRSQIRVYLYDDLRKDAAAVMKDIFRFLEIDDSFEPDVSTRVNISGIPRSLWLREVLNSSNNPLKTVAKQVFPPQIRKYIGHRFKSFNMMRPDMATQTYNSLTIDYSDDISKLESLIQRDLSMWFIKK